MFFQVSGKQPNLYKLMIFLLYKNSSNSNMIFLRSVNLIFLTVFWSTCSFEMKSGFLSFIGKPQIISSVAMMVQNFNRAQHRILITVNIFYAFTRSHISEINYCKPICDWRFAKSTPGFTIPANMCITSVQVFVKCLDFGLWFLFFI